MVPNAFFFSSFLSRLSQRIPNIICWQNLTSAELAPNLQSAHACFECCWITNVLVNTAETGGETSISKSELAGIYLLPAPGIIKPCLHCCLLWELELCSWSERKKNHWLIHGVIWATVCTVNHYKSPTTRPEAEWNYLLTRRRAVWAGQRGSKEDSPASSIFNCK